MDGVLINSEPVHYRVWKKALETRGIDLDYETYKPCIGSTNRFLLNILHDNYGVDLEDEELAEEVQRLKKTMMEQEGFPVIPGVQDLLKRLKKFGYRMAIASSSPEEYIRQVVKSLRVETCFDYLMSGESVKNSKPDPDIFLETAKHLGLQPEECLVIEDSKNGCRAAEAAGMTCVAYYNPDSGMQDLSTAAMVIEGYEEIDGNFLDKVYCHDHHLPATVCETARLIIREIAEEELPCMVALSNQNSDPYVTEGEEKPLEEEIANFPNYRKYMYEMCDMGFWAIVEKKTGKMIGRIGIEPKMWNGRNSVVELGYLIDSDYRRQGYALEACRAVLEEAEKRGARHLYCRIHSANLPSVNLARKLGFEKIDYHLEEEGNDINVYRYICNQ